MKFLLSLLAVITLSTAFSFEAKSAVVFDYLATCDNCENPKEVAKSAIPTYQSNGDDEYGEPIEYSVVVVDPTKNVYHYFTVFSEISSKYAFAGSLSGSKHDVAMNALAYYRAKSLLLDRLDRGTLAVPMGSSSSIENRVENTSGDLDCSNPGVVYNNATCASLYLADMRKNVLNSDVSSWTSILNDLVTSVEFSFGKINVSAKFNKKTNTVFYTQSNGAIIAFTLNDNGTGVLGVDATQSVYENGAAVHYYLSKNKLSGASGYEGQLYLDSIGCRVTRGGGLKATYIYTITRGADGSVHVNVHSQFEEVSPEIECN